MDPFSMALMGGGMVAQIAGGIMGMNDQKRLMNTQLAQERMIAAKDRLNQVRQLRSASAAVDQAGANTGVSGSSSVAGGKAGVYDQVGNNIQFIDNQLRFGAQQTKERIAINQDQGLQQLGQGMEKLGGDVFDMAGPIQQGALG